MELGELLLTLGFAIGACVFFMSCRLLIAYEQKVSLAPRILFLVLAGFVVGLLGSVIEIGRLAQADQLQLYDPYKSIPNSVAIAVLAVALALGAFGFMYYLDRKRGRSP